VLGILVAVVGTLMGGASPAWAHSGLLAASPSAGTGLPQAPGAVVLRFSEPLNLQLSSLAVTGPRNRIATTGPTLAVAGDTRAMRRRLALLRPGQYTVAWTSVSTLDGHTLRGSYGFAVGAEAPPGGRTSDNPLTSEGPLGLTGHLAALIGLSLWAGSALLGRVAVRHGVPDRRARALMTVAPAVVVAGTAASVISSAWVATGSLTRVVDVVSSSRSGHLRAAVIGLGLADMALAAIAGRQRAAWPGRVLVVAAVVAEAASGHAGASPWPLVATASFAVHLGAVGVWVFAITAALASTAVAETLRALSPAAVTAAAVVGLSGLTNAILELSEPGDVFSSGYGRALLAKAAALVLMASFGFWHWCLRAPSRRPTPGRLRVPLRLEASAAVAALAVAAVLVGIPNPPREAASADQTAAGDPVLADLGHRDALSVADASGPFVVAITLMPPRPGPVQVRLQVEGLEPGDGLRQARVTGSSATASGWETTLSPCGLGCFAGRTTVGAAGTWRLEASLVSNRGLVAVGATVPLPAPPGTAQLGRALAAMEHLSSATMHERLRSSTDTPGLSAEYQFQSPDAYAFQVNGSDDIEIGTRSFHRDDPSQPWKAQGSGVALRWPGDYFRLFWGPGAAVTILGTETVDGVASTVVAFVRPDLPAWFRLWVGQDDGLVRREEMRADGHLMDHEWGGFGVPVDIRPPG